TDGGIAWNGSTPRSSDSRCPNDERSTTKGFGPRAWRDADIRLHGGPRPDAGAGRRWSIRHRPGRPGRDLELDGREDPRLDRQGHDRTARRRGARRWPRAVAKLARDRRCDRAFRDGGPDKVGAIHLARRWCPGVADERLHRPARLRVSRWQ